MSGTGRWWWTPAVGLLLIGGLGVGLADGCRPARAPARPPNVLVVVTDTARADAFSYEAGGPTPGAKQLASDGVRYRQARSTSAWTLPAHASLFTGLYPSNHDAHHENLLLDNERLTLAELLQPTHDTAAFCENPHISPSAGFDQGFDLFVETWRSTPPMTITRSWEEFLAARTGEAAGERPFFLFVNILDPHLPYRPPPAFARATLPAGTSDEQRHRATMVAMPQAVGHMAGTAPLDDEALATLRGLYAAEVSYADTRIGGLLDLLRETGELDRTLVVWTSDHGENIGDHGLMDHQFCLYETLLHVPLILRLPGRFEGGGLEDAPAQLVDVMPTILDAVGIERERWPTMDGTPLGPEGLPPDRPVIAQTRRPLSQRAIFAEHAPGFEFARFDHRLTSIQVGQHKLILTDDGEAELYDLQADPAEARDRADEDPARVEELRTLLQKQGLASAPGPVQATPELDQATVEALRALGYLP